MKKYKRETKLDDADICYKEYLNYKDKACKVLFRPYMIATDCDLAMKRDRYKYYFDENGPNYIDPDKTNLS